MPFPQVPQAPQVPKVDLTVERLRLAAGARAPRTLYSYACDWRRFLRWTTARGCCALPVSPNDLADYITEALNGGSKITSVTRYATSINYQHRIAGLAPPCNGEIQLLLLGAQRLRREQPVQKVPVSIANLRAICAQPAEGVTCVRNRALLLFGFASALRCSNIAALDMADLLFSPRGLRVSIRHEKQDQRGVGRVLGITPAHHAETCALLALRAYLLLRGKEPGPVFQRIRNGRLHGRLHPNRINLVLKAHMASIGLEPKIYGSHSTRAGFVTEAVESNVNELLIMAQTGHRSRSSLQKYYRSTDPLRGNACQLLLGL